MLGLQWGDRAVGTFPDFHAGGHCRSVRFGSAPGHELIEDGQANVGPYGNTLTELTGRVDASKVATVTLIVGDRSSGPQPVLAGTGENDGYYVFVLDRAVLSDQSYTFTLRDAAGRVLGVFDPRSGFRS